MAVAATVVVVMMMMMMRVAALGFVPQRCHLLVGHQRVERRRRSEDAVTLTRWRHVSRLVTFAAGQRHSILRAFVCAGSCCCCCQNVATFSIHHFFSCSCARYNIMEPFFYRESFLRARVYARGTATSYTAVYNSRGYLPSSLCCKHVLWEIRCAIKIAFCCCCCCCGGNGVYFQPF